MARSFVAASGDMMESPDRAGFDSVNGTVACWFKTATTGTTKTMIRRDAATRHFLLRVTSADKVEGQIIYGGAPSVLSSGTYTDGAWHHAAFKWAWDGSTTCTIELYVDGASQGTNTGTAADPGGTIAVEIGYTLRSGPTAHWDGDIAEPSFWSAALADAEIATLANGFSADFVRPQSLVMYPRLVRELTDRRGAAATILSGTSISGHAPIIYPRRARTHEYTAAAGGSSIGLLRANAGLGGGPFSLANAGVGAIA